MPTIQMTQKIVGAFKRYTKTSDLSEIEAYTIDELKGAIRDLDWRDQGIQAAIKDRIEALESKGERNYQSLVRAVGYIIALAIAIIAVIIGAKY